MAIEFACPCGKTLKAKDEAAGKRTKCPTCGASLTVPQPATAGAVAAVSKVAHKPADDGSSAIAIDMGESSLKIEPFSSISLEAVPHSAAAPIAEPAGAVAGDRKQYKVLAPKDMGFIAKFDAAKLEETLNTWAKQGWSLRSAVMVTHVSHSGPQHDLLVIMER